MAQEITPDAIMQLGFGYWGSKTLLSAVELGLFTELAEGPLALEHLTVGSPYRFQLEIDPQVWFLEDEGYDLAVFHSHPTDSARPSRTDVENIGLWEGRPYLVLSRTTGELAAFRISDGRVEPEPLELGSE